VNNIKASLIKQDDYGNKSVRDQLFQEELNSTSKRERDSKKRATNSQAYQHLLSNQLPVVHRYVARPVVGHCSALAPDDSG
jgi:hypothetical protein